MIVLQRDVDAPPGRPWNKVLLSVHQERRHGSRKVPAPGGRAADGRQTYRLEGFWRWESHVTATPWLDRGNGASSMNTGWPHAHTDPVETEGEPCDPGALLEAEAQGLLDCVEACWEAWNFHIPTKNELDYYIPRTPGHEAS